MNPKAAFRRAYRLARVGLTNGDLQPPWWYDGNGFHLMGDAVRCLRSRIYSDVEAL
ncbi:MAG: hypothetical protein GYB21_01010 [Oceanospirillales bacterium]|nr:hypothetical protein [Oceanospirillales bacterium]